ncbi:MAG TPA: site-2 protease family protein [Solirubrobacteraceae bacterium]|jgi:Zn-dependent protease|nr:site-2 protease family protein [Solirubrobacteraceae bacterium]
MDEAPIVSAAFPTLGAYPSHSATPPASAGPPPAVPGASTIADGNAEAHGHAVVQGATAAPGAVVNGRAHVEGEPFGTQRRGLGKRIGSVLAAIVAGVAKFGAALKALLVALPNVKLLTTAGTALISVAAYSLFWGWEFAAGFVVLLFVHEMGHVIALRREGIRASAPMFVPFLGALITAKSLGDNALAEARVGLAGPVLGSLGAAAVAVAGALLHSDLLLALAYLGFFLNLFNLLPVVPLDGGRAMAAMAPWMWFLGFGALVAMVFVFPNPILFIIVLFGGMETWRRWKLRGTRSLEQAAYYRVAPRHRLIVGAVYIGLILALIFGMSETHILTSAGHSFRSI